MSRLRRPLFSSLLLVVPLALLGAASRGDPAHALAVPPGTARYIVQLADPPLATYTGDLPGLAATAPNPAAAARLRLDEAGDGGSPLAAATADLGAARIDVASPASVAYAGHLRRAQARALGAIARIAPGVRALYHYGVAFNGLTVRLTPRQALAVGELPGVVGVTPEAPVEMFMDAAADQIGAPAAWADARIGGRPNAGHGVRVAILDTGISAMHPMFDGAEFDAPDGFPQASLTVGDTRTDFDADEATLYTNDKVIVARAYMNPEVASNPTTPLPIESTHGTHVAGIAAGNVVRGGPNSAGAGDLEFSGVAPGAHLMAYKTIYAYTPEFMKMIDDAVADRADVMNNSWGTALMNMTDPEKHPISQAFQAATAANVIVVAAAGNSGALGEATLGGPHQMTGDVITVSMVETGRTFSYAVQATDDGLADDLRKLPASYIDVAEAWDTVDAPAVHGDACKGAEATELQDKVLLVEYNTACPTPVANIPDPIKPYLRPFVHQLAGAQLAGAAAVVLYKADSNIGQFDIGNFLALRGQIADLATLPPTFLVLGPKAQGLADWAKEHPALSMQLTITPERAVDRRRADAASGGTSQGPAPSFPRATLKPDISAPGVNILSAVDQGGTPAGYAQLSGTSMASPCIAGAAAVVRHAWPAWSPAQVKAALMTTADPVVGTPNGQAVASAMVQGAGRVNLEAAVDPGVLVTPPSLNLGARRGGTVSFDLRAADVRQNGNGEVVYRLHHEPGPGNGAVAPVLPAEIKVPAGGSATFTVRFDLGAPAPGLYDGRIMIENDDHLVRVVYSVRVPGPPKDVLLISARRSYNIQGNQAQFFDSPDYSAFWKPALDEAELSYDVLTITEEGQRNVLPPLSELERYRMVMVVGGDSLMPLDASPRGMTPLQMYLMGGGRMLASGWQWPHRPIFSNAQAAGSTFMLNRYFAGFELRQELGHGQNNPPAPSAPFKPMRLFESPVQLAASGSTDTAGNGGKVDVGRPLEQIVTRSGQGQPPPADTTFTPLAIEVVKPHIRSFLETADGGSVMTGVTADATLENGGRTAGVPWRAMFAGFAIEAVPPAATDPATGAARTRRADLIGLVYRWAVETADPGLAIAGPDEGGTRGPVAFEARSTATQDFSGAASWRWDAGDGRPVFTTTGSTAPIQFTAAGDYTVRVELTSRLGHTYVASKDVTIEAGGPALVFLPALAREEVLGGGVGAMR